MKRWTYPEPKSHKGARLDPNAVVLPGDDREAIRLLIKRIYFLENRLEAYAPKELLPCSVCGSAAELVGPSSTGAYAVTCTRCDRATDFFPEDAAAAVHAWNVYFR